ncbi:MAG: hypothetical protein RIM23_18420 [Coleofasciculus sp. G3-WIS-01]|uniref:hypothetical protein n=1 Tax=Coleofasciculus sp. G3-WIS-01 TaxID=3069528 RepID=UPI0032F78491
MARLGTLLPYGYSVGFHSVQPNLQMGSNVTFWIVIAMKDTECVRLLQWALLQLNLRWAGFRKVRKQACKRIQRRLIELQLSDIDAYQSYLNTHP